MLMDPQSSPLVTLHGLIKHSSNNQNIELELGGHDVLFVFYDNNVNIMGLWTEFIHPHTRSDHACIVLSSYTILRYKLEQIFFLRWHKYIRMHI